MKKFMTMLAMALMLTFFTGFTAYAAENDTDTEGCVTFDELNESDVYIKQSTRGKCTLASAAMVVKRAALISGNEDWESITESSVGSVAWGSQGLQWQFTYDGITVVHDYVSGRDALKALLEEHPEGIVAYDTYTPHAICLTDYDEETDTFYCSDPSEACAEGRYDESGAMISLDNVSAVWYVAGESLSLKEDTVKVISVSRLLEQHSEEYELD